MGGEKRSTSQIAEAIMARFSSTGVMAGTATRRQVLSTPEAKATSDMQTMYGNIARVIQTAELKSSARAASRMPVAMMVTTHGAAIMPSRVITMRAALRMSA